MSWGIQKYPVPRLELQALPKALSQVACRSKHCQRKACLSLREGSNCSISWGWGREKKLLWKPVSPHAWIKISGERESRHAWVGGRILRCSYVKGMHGKYHFSKAFQRHHHRMRREWRKRANFCNRMHLSKHTCAMMCMADRVGDFPEWKKKLCPDKHFPFLSSRH